MHAACKSAHKRKMRTADFQKTKLKVGKEKKAPSNATDTNFQARSLTILGQYNHSNETIDHSDRPIKQLFTNLRNGSQQVRAAGNVLNFIFYNFIFCLI